MVFRVYIGATLALITALTCCRSDNDHEYTNDFAVEIDGDMSVADLVAGTHSLRVVRHVSQVQVKNLVVPPLL